MPASLVNGAPPQQTPLADERGRITAPWFSYLLGLQNSGATASAIAGLPVLAPANNLSDVANVATARTNLGLGSAATHSASDFDAAGAATLAVAGIASANGTTRGLLTAADWSTFNGKQAALGFTPLNPANNLSEVTAATARTNLGLGTAATQASGAFDAAGAAAAAQAAAIAASDPVGAAAAAVAGIPNASAAVTGHLTSADWATFNGKQAALGFTPLNPANNLSEVTAATARTNLGLTGAAVMALPVSIANGGTGQSSAAAALTAMGGASLTAANTFSGSNAFSSVQVSMRWGCVVGSGASGAALAGELVGGASPVSARLQFGTDGSGWQLRIAKNQAGTVTDFMTFVDSGAISTASTTSFTAGGGFCSRVRSVTAADTATTSDHTILGNIASALTETLPAAPLTGQEFYLVNVGSAVWTISGNGKNIWAAGASAASITLAANAAAILKYDGTLWRRLL